MSGFGEGSRVRHAHLHGSETPEVDLSRVHAVHTASPKYADLWRMRMMTNHSRDPKQMVWYGVSAVKQLVRASQSPRLLVRLSHLSLSFFLGRSSSSPPCRSAWLLRLLLLHRLCPSQLAFKSAVNVESSRCTKGQTLFVKCQLPEHTQTRRKKSNYCIQSPHLE